MNWFLNLSIRWKLQFSFFAVTMVTTIYNRLLASNELSAMVEIAQNGHAPDAVIAQLQANQHAYIINSFWESGLEFVIQFFLIAFIANMFARPIINLCKALESVEKGDLTQHVPNLSRDEIGVLEKIFNNVLDKLNNILREIDANGKRMEQSAFQVARISSEIAEVSQHEEHRSGEVASAMQQLSRSSADVQSLGAEAAEKALQVDALARDGIVNVQQNIDAMRATVQEVNHASQEIQELENSAQRIHHIIDTITEIAGQTNLLALNAAIEAARAGEQGRGFAVVADEVRKLAERTSGSADEVNHIIRHLSERIQQVTAAMQSVTVKVDYNQQSAEKSAKVIELMAENVQDTAQANRSISSASNQQLEQFRQLQTTLDSLFTTLKENGAKVQGTAIIGDELRRVTGDLNQLMAGFTFVQGKTETVVAHEKRRSKRLQNSLLVRIVQDGVESEAITRDFSLSGISAWLTRSLDTEQPLELKLFPPSQDMSDYVSQQPVKLRAAIRWQRSEGGRAVCGLEFIDPDAGAQKRIKECVDFFRR